MKTFIEFINEGSDSYKVTITSQSGTKTEKDFNDLTKSLKYVAANRDGSTKIVLMKKSELSSGWIEVDWKKKLRFN